MAKRKLVASLLVLSVYVAGSIGSFSYGATGRDSREASKREEKSSIHAGAQQVTITGDHQKLTHDCKGRGFAILGDSNEITLNGECDGLVVSGDRNKIDVEAVSAINASGDENRITWGRGTNGKNPKILNTGTKNVISQKKK